MTFINYYSSPIGKLTLASDGSKLCEIWFDSQNHFSGIANNEYQIKNLPVFELTAKWLDIYFGGKNPDFTPPLSLCGTPFCLEVWKILTKIPYGQTVTYGEIAKQIAKQRQIARMSAQAVGGAVGRNPISIIVPCHRVVGTNGSLTGYAGGIDKKIKLLELEKVNMDNFFVPKKQRAYTKLK